MDYDRMDRLMPVFEYFPLMEVRTGDRKLMKKKRKAFFARKKKR